MSVPLCAWLGCVNLQFGQQTCTGWSSWPGPAGSVSSPEVSLDPSHLNLSLSSYSQSDSEDLQ